ncbi:hypothetical protein J6590_079327 [Homalodisca vitripennis]|nr:hypothetical protein J6590_079327 [Homalodisca vitripennis]
MRVGILREDPLCTIFDEQEETGEHLVFDCPAIASILIASLGIEFPQEDLIGCFRRFVELLKPYTGRPHGVLPWCAKGP